MENEIQKIMRLLKCSEEEAKDVIASDKAIDKGERMPFDLDPATEKMAKKFANSKTKKKPTVYNFDTSTRKRKEDTTKSGIISAIAKFLEENEEFSAESVEITNKECQIDFKIGEDSYYLKLSKRRKEKN